MKLKISLLVGSLLTNVIVGAATLRVNSVLDGPNGHDANPGDGICDNNFGNNTCSLRTALEEANATPESDTILFAAALNDAVFVLAASEGPLPLITDRVVILGNAATPSATSLRDAPPQYTIDGSQLNGLPSGLVFEGAGASGSRLSTLGIINFAGNGILIRSGATAIDIDGTYIGVRPSDFTAAGNGFNGIHVIANGSHNIGQMPNTTGSGFVRLGNVISSNGRSGIRLENANSVDIFSNWIGLSASGNGDRGNGQYGIHATGDNNRIGSFDSSQSAGNFVVANNLGSMLITGDGNTILSNTLGRSETGDFIASEGDGIVVLGNNNSIGGDIANSSSGNKIYEHAREAIQLGQIPSSAANNNFVFNNLIGSAGSQNPMLLSGNRGGIEVANGDSNLIADNIIINSLETGIFIRGDFNTLEGNQVGFVGSPSAPISEPNQTGIFILGDSNGIGVFDNGNLIGGNIDEGLIVDGNNNNILANLIGVSGNFAAIGNGGNGVRVSGFGSAINENTIGFNAMNGLVLDGLINGFAVANNFIGIAPNRRNIGNGANGIAVVNGSNNIDIIANSIAFNSTNGISADSSVSDVLWLLNLMHDNSVLGIDLNTNGRSPNDQGDSDEGANRLQNFPIIENVVLDMLPNPSVITISARVDTDASNAVYPLFVDYYWSDDDENAQGRFYLATITYDTPNAVSTRSFNFANGVFGGWVTAVARDQDGNSSELADRVVFGDPEEVFFDDGFED